MTAPTDQEIAAFILCGSVHPRAARFPLMSEAELRELGQDIELHGQREPIKVWKEGGKLILADGRNRVAAAMLKGWQRTKLQSAVIECAAEEIEAQINSWNLHRRHLKPAERQELLIEMVAANPEKSDRQLAREATVDHKTIGKARRSGEDMGKVPHVERTDTKGRKVGAKPARPAPVAKPEVTMTVDPTDKTPQPEVTMTPDEIRAAGRSEIKALRERMASLPYAVALSFRRIANEVIAKKKTAQATSEVAYGKQLWAEMTLAERHEFQDWILAQELPALDASSAAGEPLAVASTPPAATPIAETEHGPVEAPAAARTWYGKKPPVACNHKDGICGYEKCAGIGCCQVTAALPLGTPQRKPARTEAPAVAL